MLNLFTAIALEAEWNRNEGLYHSRGELVQLYTYTLKHLTPRIIKAQARAAAARIQARRLRS